MGPIEILAPAGSLLASLTNILALFEIFNLDVGVLVMQYTKNDSQIKILKIP